MEKKSNPAKEKSYAFALRIVKLYQYLCESKKEFVLSKQLVRSGTSIGSKYAWYMGNSSQTMTHSVGHFEPNKAGLFDMAGNVLEYVWYTKPAEPNYTRIYGGGYIDPPSQLGGDYSVYEEKSSSSATDLKSYVGFRVVRTYR